MTTRKTPAPQNRQQTGRRADGKFTPGCSGNPGGRPKAIADIRELARQHSDTAINTLVKIASSGKSEAARVSASAALLDRGWGKPTQPLAGDPDGPPIGVDVSGEIALRQAAAQAMVSKIFGVDGDEQGPVRDA